MANLDVYVADRRLFINTRNYILNYVLNQLKKHGINFRILEKVVQPVYTGDTAIVHVDLTVLPEYYRQVKYIYKRCINGNAINIAKKKFSKIILNRESVYKGPVIVKTNLNHRGIPELLHACGRGLFGLPYLVNIKELMKLYTPEYRLFNSIESIPLEIWNNPKLIVEKFIPGNMNLPVVKYRYDFFLDVEINTKSTFDSLLCDPDKIINVEFIDQIPSAVKCLRRELNIDFGSIDYFIIDNDVFIIDANKTTTFTTDWYKKYTGIRNYMNSISERLIKFSD